MRFLSRLQACLGAAVVFILYFSFSNSSYIDHHITTLWTKDSHRIVVFGNDWSDIGKYQSHPPPLSLRPARDPDRGDIWVETLCQELASANPVRNNTTKPSQLHCNIENFARSRSTDSNVVSIGSIVDLQTLSRTTNGESDHDTLPSLDFKAQVQQFLDLNKGSRYFPGRQRLINANTIFTVYFGLWDIVEYAELKTDYAMLALQNSVMELFKELDKLAEDAAMPIKVVLPRMVDITFLPRFQSKQNDTQGQYAEEQHNLIYLWTFWNTVLVRLANQWDKGEIYMPDTNNLIMQQIKAGQLQIAGALDGSNYSTQEPLFGSVDRPCLVPTLENGVKTFKKCAHPDQHLFWYAASLEIRYLILT